MSLVNRRLSFVEGTMAMHAQSWCPFFSHFFCNRLSYKCVFVSAAQWQRAEFQWTKEQQGIDPSFLFLEFLFRYQCCCLLHGLQMHVNFFVSCVGLTMGIECWRVEYKLTLKMITATHGLTRVEYMICGKAFTRSSHFWGTKLLATALAPKVLLVHSSFGRATCIFSKRCECAFRVFCVWSVHFVGNVLIHHGPFFYCSSGTRSRCFDQKSVGISDRSVARYLRSERRKFWRSWTLPVGSKTSFPFRSRASKMLAKWPIDARTQAHLCSTNAKSFASLPVVWTSWRTYDLVTERQSPK